MSFKLTNLLPKYGRTFRRILIYIYLLDWIIFGCIRIDSVTLKVASYEIITEVLLKI